MLWFIRWLVWSILWWWSSHPIESLLQEESQGAFLPQVHRVVTQCWNREETPCLYVCVWLLN